MREEPRICDCGRMVFSHVHAFSAEVGAMKGGCHACVIHRRSKHLARLDVRRHA